MLNKSLFSAWTIALMSVLFFHGCADPNARAMVALATTDSVAPIDALEIHLISDVRFSDARVNSALNRRGWDSGEFARNFATELAARLGTHGVRVTRVVSSWGPQQAFSLSPGNVRGEDQTQMTLRVSSANLLILQSEFSEAVAGISLPLHVTVRRAKKVLWEGQATATPASIDPTAANRFGIALANSLTDARLIGKVP